MNRYYNLSNSSDMKFKMEGLIQTGLMNRLNMEPLMSRGLMDVQRTICICHCDG